MRGQRNWINTQVETAFLLGEYRRTPVFLRSLQALVRLMTAGEPEVRTVQFWTTGLSAAERRLFDKLSRLPGAAADAVDGMTRYRIPYAELAAYCDRLDPRGKAAGYPIPFS